MRQCVAARAAIFTRITRLVDPHNVSGLQDACELADRSCVRHKIPAISGDICSAGDYSGRVRYDISDVLRHTRVVVGGLIAQIKEWKTAKIGHAPDEGGASIDRPRIATVCHSN